MSGKLILGCEAQAQPGSPPEREQMFMRDIKVLREEISRLMVEKAKVEQESRDWHTKYALERANHITAMAKSSAFQEVIELLINKLRE